jgi:hypothetical protein
MLAQGQYAARAIEAGLGRTKGGAEQVAVAFQILDEGECQGKVISWYGYFTDKTVDRTLDSLRICGWRGDDLSDLTGVTDNEVKLVVETEEYEGKLQARVRWINAAGGVALKDRLSAEDAKVFAARMRGRVAASAAKSGQPPPATTKQPPKDEPPDDLPF